MLDDQPGLRPRSLFQIILKVLGIFFLRDVIVIMPKISVLFVGLSGNLPESSGSFTVLSVLGEIVISLIMPWLLLFKTDLLIERLRLDEGFLEQTIPLNVHRITVLRLAVLITGGLVVIDAAPELVQRVLEYFAWNTTDYAGNSWTLFVYPAARLILGLLIIGNQQQLVNWLELRRRVGK